MSEVATILGKARRLFGPPALFMGLAALFGLSAMAFLKGHEVFGVAMTFAAILGLDALVESRIQRARADQALLFVQMLTSGNDTSVTVDVNYHRAAPDGSPSRAQTGASHE